MSPIVAGCLGAYISGTQAMGIIQNLNPADYHVTVVSADTFTTFTPLLPCMRLNAATA